MRHQDTTITLTGQLTRTDGKKVAFKALQRFTAQSRFGVTTFWQSIASC